MRRALPIAVAVLVGACLLSRLSNEERKLEDELADEVGETDRYVDMGILLRVVRMDLEHGEQLLPDCPPMKVLREHRLGGIVDTKSVPPKRTGASPDPVIWHCSEDQEPLVLHRSPMKSRVLVYGSERAGKTTTQAMWHAIQVLRHLGEGREGGQTAPTDSRLEMFRTEAAHMWHPSWYRYKASEDLYEFVDGSRVRLVSTYQQTKDQGSRVQGYTWSWCGSDELQDHSKYDADIESRGSKAKGGAYPRLATATAKDHSTWRTFRDRLLAPGGLWEKRTLLGLRSPFVWPKFWAEKLITMEPREYRRRVLAEDVPAELAVFFCWERERNLVVRPQIATDVTPSVLAGYRSYVQPGAQFSILVGHDPGNIFNTSVVLKLLMFGDVPTWTVVGELQTKQTTAREHGKRLKEYLQRDFGVEVGGDKAVVFIDPHGRGETKTDWQTVYLAFQKEGLDAFNPAPVSGMVHRAARVGMTNRLLYSAGGGMRLAVACDRQRQPSAPILVDALESLEKKPGDDAAEGTHRKDETDKTHAPAALGFALWPFEQEALTDHTVKTARAAARRG